MEIINIEGDITTENSNELKQKLSEKFDKNLYDIAVNLEKAKFLCSAGLGVLISGYKQTKMKGGILDLIIPPENSEIMQVLQITRLDKIFKVHNSVSDIK
jgi:anti-sigma B factor antagonist